MISRLLYRLTAHLPCRLISRDGAPYLEALTGYARAVDAAVAP